MKDVIIIGGGPAGLAVCNSLQQGGMDAVVYEKGALADAIRRFPYYMKWFSTATNLELSDYPLIITDEKPNREEYLNYLRRFVQNRNLNVVTGHEVREVLPIEGAGSEAAGGDAAGREIAKKSGESESGENRASNAAGFVVRGVSHWQEAFEDRARFIVVANGAFDHPQLLGVPGEDLPKVSHYFIEVHPYAGKKVAVIGGKTSAVETALLLYRAGAEVTLIHRGPNVSGLKYWMEPDIKNRLEKGEIKAWFNSRVREILPREVVIETADGETVRLENDFVLAMTGYQPDVEFLQSMGIEIDPASKRPKYNPETLETNVPGIFVAGVITAGNVSGEVFIENSRQHGEQIVSAIRRRTPRQPVGRL